VGKGKALVIRYRKKVVGFIREIRFIGGIGYFVAIQNKPS